MTDDATDGATVRLTYAELAAARGVTVQAARRLALRHRWPKQIGNDGLTRVSVPTEYACDIGSHDGSDVATDVVARLDADSLAAVARAATDAMTDALTDIRSVVPTLRDAILSLRIELLAERERADRAERELRELRTRRSWWPWRR